MTASRASVHAAAPCSRKAAREDLLAVERRARELADDLAPAHHQDAVAHRHQLLDLRGDEEHAAAVGGEPVDDRVDLDTWPPTSMPRVGSSRMKIDGSDISHLAITTFCWLPPDRLLRRLRRATLALMLQRLGQLRRGAVACRVCVDELERRHGEASAAPQARCCRRSRTFISSPSSRRFSVTKAMPLRMLLARRVPVERAAADDDLAGVEAVEAEEDARELGAARAHQAEEAEHLAAVQREARCP